MALSPVQYHAGMILACPACRVGFHVPEAQLWEPSVPFKCACGAIKVVHRHECEAPVNPDGTTDCADWLERAAESP